MNYGGVTFVHANKDKVTSHNPKNTSENTGRSAFRLALLFNRLAGTSVSFRNPASQRPSLYPDCDTLTLIWNGAQGTTHAFVSASEDWHRF